jgi:hypothetical protein
LGQEPAIAKHARFVGMHGSLYLAISEDLLHMENLGVRFTDDGYTIVGENAKTVHCATGWKYLVAFEDLLFIRLASL